MRPARRSLLGIVGRRVLAFGLLAMVVQFGVVLQEYWSDQDTLARRLIETETAALAAGIRADAAGLHFAMPPALAARYRDRGEADDTPGDDEPADAGADHDDQSRRGGEGETAADPAVADGYYVRVHTGDGAVLYSNCTDDCLEHFLPLTVNPPTFWQRRLAPGQPPSVAGGRSFDVGDRRVAVDIAVLRDPDGRIWSTLGHETIDDMLIPMALQLTLVFGATLWSVRSALRPVRRAVAMADAMDPRDAVTRLPVAGMPSEIAHFTRAVNRALDRVRDLVHGQKLFAAAIAHEIRTPAAIVRMELEHIDHPRARKALTDLERMTHVLEQLTALARVDTVDSAAFLPVDLAALAADTVALLAPAAFDAGQTIAFEEAPTGDVEAVPSLVETLLRNLVDNAVRHNPPGTTVTVTAGPGPVLSVADDGRGLDPAGEDGDESGAKRRSDGLGIGRRIVARIAEIHGATITTTTAPGAGTTVTVQFHG